MENIRGMMSYQYDMIWKVAFYNANIATGTVVYVWKFSQGDIEIV